MVSGQQEQVVPFQARQVQSLGDGRDHLLGRLGPGAALEAGVVVGRHVAERRDFFTAESGGAATRAPSEAHVFGLQRLAAAQEEVRQADPVDLHGSPFARSVVLLCTGRAEAQPLIVTPPLHTRAR